VLLVVVSSNPFQDDARYHRWNHGKNMIWYTREEQLVIIMSIYAFKKRGLPYEMILMILDYLD